MFAARRARQFYRMRETTLCDICEGNDCGDNCEIRASEQRSVKSAFGDDKTSLEDFAKANAHSIKSTGFTFFLLPFIVLILVVK